MPRRISFSLVLHNHQPVGNFGWVFEEVYRRAYEPMVGALERHPGVRVGLHYTGSLLDWLRVEHPQLIDRIRVLVGRGQVEVLGGGYYEPILPALPEPDRHGQLVRMRHRIEALFGSRPRGAWLAERVWEPSAPNDLASAGYEWTILDDNHLRAASVREDAMWGAYTTDDQGRRLTVFGTEQGLRYRIPFGEVDDLMSYLRDHASEGGERLGIMGDDGEKFGSWPDTFEHCWGEGRWVDRCFEALEANSYWLRTITPSGWLEREEPLGRIYVPASSYVEMTEWALPAAESNLFHEVLTRAREERRAEARFLQGGLWRNFQAKYREVNDLHKQMLRVSAKVGALPDGETRQRALDHLYRGQSNDCYWHGLFGGIYIVHMRMATLADLIAAEDIADRAAGPRDGSDREGIDASEGDFDLDGLPDLFLQAPGQTVLIDLAEGAGISSWDLRASRIALASVMRRRPEAYHEALLRLEAVPRGHDPGDDAGTAPKTIHDVVRVKERGLASRLHYDAYERRSALVHLLPAASDGALHPTASELASGGYRELGDFVAGRFEIAARDTDGGDGIVLAREGRLRSGHGDRALSVTKRISLGGGRLDPSLSLEVTVRNESAEELAEFELGVEWGFNLMGGGANPAAYYERPRDVGTGIGRATHDSIGDCPETTRLAFGNLHEGVRIVACPDPPARCTWFPIETISNSEAGFERAYQGSALWFRWPVRLGPGEARRFTTRFDVEQERDRAVVAGEPEGDVPGER